MNIYEYMVNPDTCKTPDPKTTPCPGAGRHWWKGTTTAQDICPVCRRGPRGMGITGRLPKVVPPHTIR